jgi:hypothetical protein
MMYALCQHSHCHRAWDLVDPRTAEPALSCALFNPTCLSFVTCNANWVSLWDACKGQLLRSKPATRQEITCELLLH